MTNFQHTEITERIINCYYKVYNKLGYGFLEKVYEKSLSIELISSGLRILNQYPIKVFYNKVQVGEYYADILVNENIILEIKATSELIEVHEAQLLNYLKATNIEIGLLLNFGPKPEVKRKYYSNEKKNLF
jgi:GxxExxY protein